LSSLTRAVGDVSTPVKSPRLRFVKSLVTPQILFWTANLADVARQILAPRKCEDRLWRLGLFLSAPWLEAPSPSKKGVDYIDWWDKAELGAFPRAFARLPTAEACVDPNSYPRTIASAPQGLPPNGDAYTPSAVLSRTRRLH
jgi:hypothetical protein